MKRLLAKLGLIKLVWLRDYDGELTLSIKRETDPPGGFYAYRHHIIRSWVKLEDDGTCSGDASYVKRWADYGESKPRAQMDMKEQINSLLTESMSQSSIIRHMSGRLDALETAALKKAKRKK